jgi:lambda repressor-like predicted transcriptional regulator
MANDLLNGAIRDSGLDIFQVADAAGVDYRTVQRWLGGRVPYPRYRQKLAAALRVDEAELWPETARSRGRAAMEEIVAASARRGDSDAPDWRALLRSADEQVDLLGYSLEQVTTAKAIIKTLATKAAGGCVVRICLADPHSDALIAADALQRPAGRLIARVQGSHRKLLELIGRPGIELRSHQLAASHTVLRFDEDMLLTIHLHGTPGFQAPVLHLRRELDYGIFDQLAKHFEDIWDTAIPVGADGQPSASQARSAAAAQAAEREKQDFLDSLDHSYRPGS